MKAIRYARFGGPDVLALEEIASPVPGANEVLIGIEATSVTPGECKRRGGRLQTSSPVELPAVPGGDGTGTIAAIGEQVEYARVGDAVYFLADRTIQGSYAESIVRDAGCIVPLPPGLSFAEAAAVVHAGTCAWIALVRYAGLRPAQRVLIHAGAGAVGGMAVQLARHLGAWVAATCSARNSEYVRGLGAHRVVEYDSDDFALRLRDCDVVLDLIGGEVHRRSYAVLGKGGRLVWLAAEPVEDLSARYGVRSVPVRIEDDLETRARVADLANRGILKPQVSRIMPLAEAAQAHRLVEEKANSRGRIVLDVRGRAAQRPLPAGAA